jgi:hypothetical protein
MGDPRVSETRADETAPAAVIDLRDEVVEQRPASLTD